MRSTRFKEYFFILITSSIIFCYKLGIDSFWRDEAFMINLSGKSLFDIIHISGLETYPFLYPFFLHYYFMLFPLSEFWARLPSVLFIVLTIFVIFFIINNIFKDKTTRFMSLFLVILNPVLVWYAREARAYSMLSFWVFSSLTLSIFLKNFPSKKYLYPFLILSTVLGLYTHNVFVLIVFANLVISFDYDFILLVSCVFQFKIFIRNFKLILFKRKYLIISYFIIFLLYLPWLIVLNKQINYLQARPFWFEFQPLHDLKMNLLKIFIFEPKVFRLNTFFTIFLYFSFWLNIITLISNIRGLLLHNIRSFWYKNISVWFWVLFFLFFVYSFKIPIFYIRYMLFLIPIVLIMNIYELKRLHFKGLWLLIVLIPLLISFFSTFGYLKFSGANKADMKTLSKDICILKNKKNNVLVLHARAYTYHAFSFYCDNVSSFIYTPKDELAFYEGVAILTDNDFFYGDLSNYDMVFNIYLSNKESADLVYKLQDSGFDLLSKKIYFGDLFLEEWKKV